MSRSIEKVLKNHRPYGGIGERYEGTKCPKLRFVVDRLDVHGVSTDVQFKVVRGRSPHGSLARDPYRIVFSNLTQKYAHSLVTII